MSEDDFTREMFSDTGEQPIIDYQKYLIEMYSGNERNLTVDTFATYGSWVVEGNFIVVWDKAGIRHAHRIHEDVDFIKTIPVPPGGRHEMMEDNGEEEVADDEEAVASESEAVHNGATQH